MATRRAHGRSKATVLAMRLGVAVRRGDGTGGTMGSPGQYQWPGAYGTAFWVDPEEDLVIVLMAQTPGEIRRFNRQLIPALVYQAIVE